MQKDPNNKTQLLDAESAEEEVSERFPQQPDVLPPSYQMATGISSIPNQSISSQSSVWNYGTPVSSQLPYTTHYGYPQPQPTTVQVTFHGGASALPIGQPMYVIPTAPVMSENISQCSNINQWETSQHEPIVTEPSHTGLSMSDEVHEKDSYNDPYSICCTAVLLISLGTMMCIAVIYFFMKIINL